MKNFLAKLLIVQIFGMVSLFAHVRLEIFRGSEILPFIPQLTQISLIVNRDSPASCAIGEDPEFYLTQYSQSKAAILCLAYDGCQIVGFTIGAPLSACLLFFPGFLCTDTLDVERLFYIGEISLLPTYRKGGIGREMLYLVERVIRREPIYFGICLLSLDERSRDLSVGFLSSPHFWENMGYERCHFFGDSYQGVVHWAKIFQDRGVSNLMWDQQFSIPNGNIVGDFY